MFNFVFPVALWRAAKFDPASPRKLSRGCRSRYPQILLGNRAGVFRLNHIQI